MRDIKFRFWDKEEKSMTYDLFLQVDKIGKIGVCDIDGFLSMQYTELKDKNGKEVYESDIIKELGDYGNEYVVRWSNGHCSFRAYLDNDRDLSTSTTMLADFEIIGNIHENPEL